MNLTTADRSATLAAVAERILALSCAHPVRVAVDGRTASGKTTFADDLAGVLTTSGRPVIRASVDGFHQPARIRRRQGRRSPDGYYEDGRDLQAVRRLLLDPLGPGGDRAYVTASFDLARDVPMDLQYSTAPEDAVLVMDGTFLQRPELRTGFDFVIFLDVEEAEAFRRGMERDAAAHGGADAAAALHRDRYGPAFDRYVREHRPARRADVVVDNSDWTRPSIR